jgi:hypothetical protein
LTLDDVVPDELPQRMMLFAEKYASGVIYEDAEELAKYVRPTLGRNSNKYHAYIADAIA